MLQMKYLKNMFSKASVFYFFPSSITVMAVTPVVFPTVFPAVFQTSTTDAASDPTPASGLTFVPILSDFSLLAPATCCLTIFQHYYR